MLQLRKISTTDPTYNQVENLFLSAFPEDERRDTPQQRENVDHSPIFHCITAEDEGDFVGFITYWDFDTFVYIEHFATSPAKRNNGYGSKIMNAIQESVSKPIILEVELTEDDLSQRRIGFYQRQGFTLWSEHPYIQPPYRQGGNPLPMLLMATEGLIADKDFPSIVNTIHHHVYNVK